jgi:FKBP-type peptidyl-prolyl cis-trans isomerase
MNYVHAPRSLVVLFALVLLVLGTPHPGLALQQSPAQPVAVPAPPDVAAPPADAQKTPSGLYTKVITPGTGTVHPHPVDKVTVNYAGWTSDGAIFDSTAARNKPSVLQLNRVLPGWTEGVQLMVVGEKRRLWVPEKLAFGGAPGKPKGTVVFDIELLSIEEAPVAPLDVAAPPADAQKTGSGLASKVLKAGTGTVHPAKDSTVTVHYTGWTTDGQMFDSSEMAGKPATFSLGQVIRGWTEGVQLMVQGEKRRFWIPEKLAYGGQSGRPKGMLVFDVELLSIGQ